MRSLKTHEGWIFDKQIKHERCDYCRVACGPTLIALLSSRALNERWAAMLLVKIADVRQTHENGVRAAARGAGAA